MGAGKALDWAEAREGIIEHPANSNKGPWITDWQVQSGYPNAGVPWCQCYANAAAVIGGAVLIRDGFTPDFLNGRYERSGYTVIDVADAQPGDFIYYKWPGVSNNSCDHVGILLHKTATTITCIEGNTSPEDSGSQNNGGGVWIRTRSRSLSPGACSVPYPEDRAYRNLLLGMAGRDVTYFQQAITAHANYLNRPDRTCTIDGQYGSETKENGAWCAFMMGIGDSTDQIKSGGISAYVQNLVRNPDQRNDVQLQRAVARRELHGG